jgi:hypothetical protein
MLLSTNIGSHIFRKSKRILLIGSCVFQEHPDIMEKYAKDRVCLHVCLETYHMNMAETKLACLLKLHEPTELIVLTVDGSPHCLQLHVIAEDMRRYFNFETPIQHIVIEHGSTHVISGVAVKTARHLFKVQQLIDLQKPAKPS